MQQVALLGATGSIGRSTLNVLRLHRGRFHLRAACAATSDEALFEIAREFHPEVLALSDETAAARLEKALRGAHLKCQVYAREDGVCEAARGADIVVAAIVGAAGLRPVLAAVAGGCRLALANKEALVMSGALLFAAAARSGAQVIPVDSEHSAIFQCLPAAAQQNLGHCDLKSLGVSRILLTGSGGPLRQVPLSHLAEVTPAEALCHPVWSMGPKITVDSATMMNKGLEFIEACRLFNAAPDDIEVLIHPQGVVHSMVSYADGAVLAQFGLPDMCTPISLALSYPVRRTSGVKPFDFTAMGPLEFSAPDFARYPCLKLAIEACRAGQAATTVLNAANESAVSAFLAGRLAYTGIHAVCAETLSRVQSPEPQNLDEIFALDEAARREASAIAAGLERRP